MADDKYSRQENYRRRLQFKARCFDERDAERQSRMRHQIHRLCLRGEVPAEQRALFPFFLSHPQAETLIEISRADEPGVWLGHGPHFEACLAYVAFRSVSSGPASFQYAGSDWSGEVTRDDPLVERIKADVNDIRNYGLWVAA